MSTPAAQAGPITPAELIAHLHRDGWRGFSLLRRYLAENPGEARRLARQLLPVAWASRPDFAARQVRFGFVGAAATAGLDGPLLLEALSRGIIPSTYHAATRDPRVELTDPGSGLMRFAADVVAVSNRPAAPGESSAAGSGEEWVHGLIADVKNFRTRSNAVLLIHSVVAPEFAPLGRDDWRDGGGAGARCARLNTILAEALTAIPDAHLVDLGHLIALSGGRWWTAHRSAFLAGALADDPLATFLCRDYAAFGAALRGFTRKCLVLDLDDTLWGGVVSEVGPARLEIGTAYPGNLFHAIQEIVRHLHNRGVLLALNSRNHEHDAWQAFTSRPEMALGRDHFAAWRINWSDKVENLTELAAELKLGLDAFVVLDNDPVEQAWIEQQLPEVHVIPATDPLLMLQSLMTTRVFDGLSRSAEDGNRALSYGRAAQRRVAAETTPDRAGFLASLGLTVTIGPAAPQHLPRLAQLTQRTNQFTLTARRYTETELQRMMTSDDTRLLFCACRDRFGDEGIVGFAIVHRGAQEWVIDTFLISCRVLGWGVERALADAVVRIAAASGASALRGEHVPTNRNGMTRDFFPSLGFSPSPADAGHEAWRLDLPAAPLAPAWIHLEGDVR